MLLFQPPMVCGSSPDSGGQELSALSAPGSSAAARNMRMSGEWSRMGSWRARWSRISIWRGVFEILGVTRLAEHIGTYQTRSFLYIFLGWMWGLANSSVSDSNHTLRPLLIWYHCDRDTDCINSSSIVPAEIAMNKMRHSYHLERERETHTHIYIISTDLSYLIFTWLISWGPWINRTSPHFQKALAHLWPKCALSSGCATWWISLGFQQSEICPTGGTGNGGNYPWSSPWSVWRTQRTRWPSGCCCGKWWDSFFRSFQPGVEALVTKDGFERSL